MMFGYATNETKEFMPSAVVYALERSVMLYVFAKAHLDQFGIDIKTQVTLDYGTKENFTHGKVQNITTIVAAIPHVSHLSIDEVRQTIKGVICETLKDDPLFHAETVEFFIDHTGRFVTHSFIADSGLTGRKVVCDTYGVTRPLEEALKALKTIVKLIVQVFMWHDGSPSML